MGLAFSLSIYAALICGLVFGSFLNVCIARLPAHRSIVSPPSHCEACGAHIRAFDNVPVASWLVLHGRCRDCRSRISIQYPLVELGTALLWLACVLHTGATWQTLIDAVACFLLLGLAVMDAQTMRLPDAFTLSGLVIAFVLRVSTSGTQRRGFVALHTAEDAAIGAAILLAVSAIYWLVRRREGVGMGDVKLMAMMGALIGLRLTLFAYFVGILGAALFAAILLARRKAHRFDRIPFGSFLAAGGILAIFAGRPATARYLALFH